MHVLHPLVALSSQCISADFIGLIALQRKKNSSCIYYSTYIKSFIYLKCLLKSTGVLIVVPIKSINGLKSFLNMCSICLGARNDKKST
jgi:hypothetical protein